ncbi:hypothetical protein LZ318_12815 [Saccharopolyspora indica]|uniref:hypothetical protein n=1 Tax=Saccharopolyspora indica TaxID=1229659 RepID=UPI0022EB6CE1|nr:hypothetical protein [Saccharopolyspora indica]MDA3648805.1 hypothetical protein [Saccharopolyspora indica]
MSNPLDNPNLRVLTEQLDAALAEGKRVAEEAAQIGRYAPAFTDEDLAEIEQFARGDQAPPELRDLQRRIDAGELSWQDVRAGRVADDPGVLRGLSAGMPAFEEAHTLLREGHDVDEVIAAREPAPEQPVASDAPPRPAEPNWDDPDDLGNNSWMDRPSQW